MPEVRSWVEVFHKRGAQKASSDKWPLLLFWRFLIDKDPHNDRKNGGQVEDCDCSRKRHALNAVKIKTKSYGPAKPSHKEKRCVAFKDPYLRLFNSVEGHDKADKRAKENDLNRRDMRIKFHQRVDDAEK